MNAPAVSGITTPGVFNQASQGAGGWGGLMIGRQYTKEWLLTGRLQYSTMGGTALAPDSVMSGIYVDSTRSYVGYQEGTSMRITAPYLSLALGAEYSPQRYFYLTGGVLASMALGKSVHVERQVLQPGNAAFPGGARSVVVSPQSLDALQSLNVGLYGGLGVTYPITFTTSVFVEGTYTTILNNIVSDVAWRVQYLSLSVGARYRW
jgi:hypothetical protein